MYVREIKIRRGMGTWDDPLKVYSYFQLVRSYRDPDTGKVKKQVVKHLGRWSDREAAMWVARTEGYLCGALGCGREGVEEWAVVRRSFRRGRAAALLCEEHGHEFKATGLRLVRYDPEWRANLIPNFA